jgi:hypothetical protein
MRISTMNDGPGSKSGGVGGNRTEICDYGTAVVIEPLG